MCGICGIVNAAGESVDAALLARMRDTLTHRGPDHGGQMERGHVGLAMRRLSIIDLQTGSQPIYNEDGSICIVFNGEIYNYRELRDELIAKGHRFSTESDTEVIVHLYEELGDDCVTRLNGMFGFAIWDAQRNRLLLARDRLGIKPLYYAQNQDQLLFASELKALLPHPAVGREIDPVAVSEYLTFEYVPAPRSIFKHIKKMLPATRLVFENGRLSTSQYWDVAFEANQEYANEELCSEAIREHLKEAVRLRLRSDVPLGVLLSGGVDSSSIVGMMHALDTPVNSFSIGFEEPEYNELNVAAAVSKHFGTNHHSLNLTARDVTQLLPTIIGFLDEPLADASIVPTFLVCRLAREHVTVALSGDGGDELFGGYETYKAHRLARYYRLLPECVRAGVRATVRRLPVSSSHRGFAFKANKFTSAVGFPLLRANALWWGAYTPELRERVLSTGVGGPDPFDPVNRVQEAYTDSGDYLDNVFYSDLKLYLQDDLLVKVDRMSMANSLEVRVPFLDHKMVEFAARIPSRLKVKGMRLKYILRRAMAAVIPPEITRLPKRGFDLPLDDWIRGPLKEFTTDILAAETLAGSGLFNPQFVSHLLDEHLSRRANHRQLLWPLVIFETWRQKYA